jgi:prevent-host-death family protein
MTVANMLGAGFGVMMPGVRAACFTSSEADERSSSTKRRAPPTPARVICGRVHSHLHGALPRHRHLPGYSLAVSRKVSLAEARDHLTGLVRDVERGDRVELTRRGKPVAILLSQAEYDRLRADRLSPSAALRAWREEAPADYNGFDLPERDPSPGRDVRY